MSYSHGRFVVIKYGLVGKRNYDVQFFSFIIDIFPMHYNTVKYGTYY